MVKFANTLCRRCHQPVEQAVKVTVQLGEAGGFSAVLCRYHAALFAEFALVNMGFDIEREEWQEGILNRVRSGGG